MAVRVRSFLLCKSEPKDIHGGWAIETASAPALIPEEATDTFKADLWGFVTVDFEDEWNTHRVEVEPFAADGSPVGAVVGATMDPPRPSVLSAEFSIPLQLVLTPTPASYRIELRIDGVVAAHAPFVVKTKLGPHRNVPVPRGN
jgi:hypothetical protein